MKLQTYDELAAERDRLRERIEVLEWQRCSDADALNTVMRENYAGHSQVSVYPICSWATAFEALVAGVEHGVRFREVRPLKADLARLTPRITSEDAQ